MLFWMSQGILPLIAALIPPIALASKHDFYGSYDQIATGAVSFIGVFLLLAVALDLAASAKTAKKTAYDAHHHLFIMLIMFCCMFLMICTVAGALYALGTLLPYHQKYRQSDQSLVVDDNLAAHDALTFCVISIVIYVTGVVVAIRYRYVALKHGFLRI